MTDNKPEVSDSSEQETEIVSPVDETDEFEQLFQEEGKEDVAGKSEVENLSLEELNNLAGRKDNPFKSKAEYIKHYENLKNFVGKKETPKVDTSVDDRVTNLEKQLEREKFINNNPTVKEHIDIIEAYAKDKGLTLDEALNERFKAFAETSQKKVLTPNNRLNPATPKIPLDLVDNAKKGSEKSQLELVDKWFAGAK
jgi:hypothetical protein